MSGEIGLQNLIKGMQPQLQPGEYVFCSVPAYQVSANIEPIGIFREAEGVTLIVTRQQAQRLSLPYPFIAKWITLTVHSSLAAVGFTAAISERLAMAGISCNVIAAYYHDHLFVGVQDAQRAMEILTGMSNE